jgi:hypothetical protein
MPPERELGAGALVVVQVEQEVRLVLVGIGQRGEQRAPVRSSRSSLA